MARRSRRKRSDLDFLYTVLTSPITWWITGAVTVVSVLGRLTLPALAAVAAGVFVWRRRKHLRDLRVRANWALTAHDLQEIVDRGDKELEHLVAVLCREEGYRDVTVMGGSGDRGVDVRCTWQGQLVVVQCKCQAVSRPVGSPALQLFVGTIHLHRASRGIFVTTSSYTREARAIAHERGIVLLDGPQLVAWLNRVRAVHEARRPGAQPT